MPIHCNFSAGGSNRLVTGLKNCGTSTGYQVRKNTMSAVKETIKDFSNTDIQKAKVNPITLGIHYSSIMNFFIFKFG